MEYRMIVGMFKKGKVHLWENNKVNKEIEVEDEVNRFLSKGWKLFGNPGSVALNNYDTSIIYHLVKD